MSFNETTFLSTLPFLNETTKQEPIHTKRKVEAKAKGKIIKENRCEWAFILAFWMEG